MPLLPKSSFEFSKTEYWDAFFKERGKKEFEWYGEYPELSGLLHKYVKPQEKLLVVGCGNSHLSACLYDVGYRNIANIDISKTVVKQMKSTNKERTEMTFEVMDALDMKFEPEMFSVVLDKGTLDALMTDDNEESIERVTKYFGEIDRVLRIGGRYIVISLMQQHIMLFLLKQFTTRAWMVRVCRCYDVETKLTQEQGYKPLPVFMVICTKFKKMENSKSILELCTTIDSPAIRLPNTDKIIESVIEAQQVAIVCAGLQKSGSAGREILLEVGKGDEEEAKYSINIVDRQKVIEDIGTVSSYAAFIIPQGRETEWAFGTPEGRQFLASEAAVDRLAVITLNRGHKFNSLEEVKAELSPIISDFSPVTNKKKIAFLSVGNDVGVRKEVYVGKSEISGHYIVEETATDGAAVRRLYFLSAKNVIQSEAKIRKVRTRRGNERVFVDTSSLSCSHHAFMCVGACSTLESNQEGQLLVIGLGGGSLCSYMKKCFQKSVITAVELDPDMLFVATEYFGLVEDKQLIVYIKDGLDFIKDSHANGVKYDVVMFDVDNKNITTGLSCPPQAFIQQDIVTKVRGLLNSKGVFVLNLVCRDKNIRREIYNRVEKTFETVGSVKLEDDLNEIIYCWTRKIDFKTAVATASDRFRNIIHHKKLEEIEAVQLSRMLDLLHLGNNNHNSSKVKK